MMVPLTILPAAKGSVPVCFMASSMVSIIKLNDDFPSDEPLGDLVSAGLPKLHCLTDQTLPGQRRLRVRFRVNFFFSASMNIRTHGVQAVLNISPPTPNASPNSVTSVTQRRRW